MTFHHDILKIAFYLRNWRIKMLLAIKYSTGYGPCLKILLTKTHLKKKKKRMLLLVAELILLVGTFGVLTRRRPFLLRWYS
jgi:hypothetical protein